jgi:hypothetical protein
MGSPEEFFATNFQRAFGLLTSPNRKRADRVLESLRKDKAPRSKAIYTIVTALRPRLERLGREE